MTFLVCVILFKVIQKHLTTKGFLSAFVCTSTTCCRTPDSLVFRMWYKPVSPRGQVGSSSDFPAWLLTLNLTITRQETEKKQPCRPVTNHSFCIYFSTDRNLNSIIRVWLIADESSGGYGTSVHVQLRWIFFFSIPVLLLWSKLGDKVEKLKSQDLH